MIFALLNIATDITLNVAWWTTKTVIGGLYNLLGNNLLEKGCTKNNNNLFKKGCTKNSTTNENNIDDERITLLMDKIDILLENNLLENNLLEKGCTKINN